MKLTNDELDEILAEAGLRIDQPYNPKQSYRKDEYLFTQCLRCGTEAHYRLKYILEKKGSTCRACYWRSWYGGAHELYGEGVRKLIASGLSRGELIEQGVIKQQKDASWNEAAELAHKHGYDLVDLMHGAHPGDDVLVVRCQACGRQTAQRPCDVSFGCTCVKSKAKGGGVPFGSEAVEVNVPLEDRNTASRTPGAQSLDQWSQRQGSEGRAQSYEFFKDKVCADIPELMAVWDDVLDPCATPVTGSRRVHLRCEKGHHPYQTPYAFLSRGCTVCRGLKTKADPNKHYLDITNPELAAEWDYAIDGDKYTPQTVASGSRRKVQWKCIACGGTWVATVEERELRMNNRCPHCGKVMGSLAWKHPEIARRWSRKNPLSPWNTKPFGTLDFKPEWVCPKDPSHVWMESVQSVMKKNGKCPYCG